MDFNKRFRDITDSSDVRNMKSMEFLKFILDSCDDGYNYVHERCDGGIEGGSREELRDYYIALGRYDMCMEILYLMCPRLVELDFDDVTGIIDRVKKLSFVYDVVLDGSNSQTFGNLGEVK